MLWRSSIEEECCIDGGGGVAAPQPSSEATVRMGGGRKPKAEVVRLSACPDETGLGRACPEEATIGGESSEMSRGGGGGAHACEAPKEAVANGEFAPNEPWRNPDERPWKERTRRRALRAALCGPESSSSEQPSSKECPMGEASGGGSGKSGLRPADTGRPAEDGWPADSGRPADRGAGEAHGLEKSPERARTKSKRRPAAVAAKERGVVDGIRAGDPIVVERRADFLAMDGWR